MKYIQTTSYTIKEDFLKNLLIDRGIIPENDDEYHQKFFNPTRENMHDPLKLDHMKEGYNLFAKHLEAGNKFYFVVDSDTDGITSSAVMINYMENHLREKYPNFTIDHHIPDGKEHGLDTLMNILTPQKNYDIIVLPDSSSNDYEYHKILKNMGYDILVLDHHEAEKYSEDAVVINNQLSKNYPNKSLSGVGVVYKFLQYCDSQLNINGADDYLDLVAAGMCGDMMDLNTLENRYICNYGFSHLKNFGLRKLVKQQGYSIFGLAADALTETFLDNAKLTPIQVAFYIAPLINALIRVGTPSEKEVLFKSFIKGDEMVPSTKRGHKGEMETLAEQSARNCTNARARQNREKDKALDLLDIQISNDCLDDNKILILNADELDVSNTLTGLCAMGVAADHKKPVLLGRVNSDGYLKGSMRGRGESELKDFKEFLLKSGYMEYVEGHANAAGFSIKASDVSKLYEYANRELADINFNEGFYEADFVVNGNCSYLSDMILDLNRGKDFYGQNCAEPIIISENITINTSAIQTIGSNKDTLKFVFNDITYIKFKAKDLINEFAQYSDKISITVAGKGNVNSWGGRETPQIFIEEIEINEVDKYVF